MNQIDYLTNNTFRHHLYAALIQQYQKICPPELRFKQTQKLPSKRMSTQETKWPTINREKIKNRADTIDIPQRTNKSYTEHKEEVQSEGQRVISTRVMVYSIYNKILNVQRVGHRMQRHQLLRYLEAFYSNLIVDQISKTLRIPETLNLLIFEQIVYQIQLLDREGYLNFCFSLYDIQGQGYITSTNLLNILAIEKNESVEKDLLKMIQYKKSVLRSQIDKNDDSTTKKIYYT